MAKLCNYFSIYCDNYSAVLTQISIVGIKILLDALLINEQEIYTRLHLLYLNCRDNKIKIPVGKTLESFKNWSLFLWLKLYVGVGDSSYAIKEIIADI